MIRSHGLAACMVAAGIASTAAGAANTGASATAARKPNAPPHGIQLAMSRQLAQLPPVQAPPPTPGERSPRNRADEDREIATALESSLIRQGGAVLSPGTIELEPEVSYFYAEPDTQARRDALATGLTLRMGLPAGLQIDVHAPYVIRDRADGVGRSSGIGDIRLGLSKELSQDREGMPAVVVFGRLRTKTGDIDRVPPTGFGQYALQTGITVSKRNEPALLYAGISYLISLGRAHLRDGSRIDAGNVFGARLGAYLAVTPDTSLNIGVSYNSSAPDRFNDERIEVTNRARGVVELGATTVIGYGRFLNIGIGIGVTPAAPRVSYSMSLPYRF